MKLLLLLTIISFLNISCNTEGRDRRTAYKNTNSGFLPFAGTYKGVADSDGNSNLNPTPIATATGRALTVPGEVNHCSWSSDGVSGFASSSSHFGGGFTVCQSRTNPLDVFIQTEKNPESQICIIPTSHNGTNSVYIGEPRCLRIYSRDIYKVSLLKNRTGYSSYPLTGVIAMKDQMYTYGTPYVQPMMSVDAYLFCFQMLNQGQSAYCQAFSAKSEHAYIQFIN